MNMRNQNQRKKQRIENGKSKNKPHNSAKKLIHRQYLICDKCGYYYELQPGESTEDLIITCNCGRKLKIP